jgi:uncharacterized membrane protein YqjE
MSDAEHQPGGWLDSLRRTVDSLLGLAQTRVELFAVELQEEKLRAINVLVGLGIALALGVAGLLVGMGALALFLWELAGYAGLVALALGALAGSAGVFWAIRNQLQRGPPPFGETIAEFRKDRECLRRKD